MNSTMNQIRQKVRRATEKSDGGGRFAMRDVATKTPLSLRSPPPPGTNIYYFPEYDNFSNL